MTAVVGQASCSECLKLRRAYILAVKERNHLQELETEAVLSKRVFSLSSELELAVLRQGVAKRALVAHASHCSSG